MSDNCENCVFVHVEWTLDKTFQCRRRAPRGQKEEGWNYRDRAVWPTVRHDDWCGEYMKKGEPEKD